MYEFVEAEVNRLVQALSDNQPDPLIGETSLLSHTLRNEKDLVLLQLMSCHQRKYSVVG